MEKLVDIFSTEDLKYKEVTEEGFVSALNFGLATPLTEVFIKDPLQSPAMSYRSEIRRMEHERENERRVSNDLDAKYERRGNVHYPEGMLKIFRDLALDTKNTEKYFSKESDFIANEAHLILIEILDKGRDWEHWSSMYPAADDLAKTLSESGEFRLFEVALQDYYREENKDVLKKVFSDPVLWEKIRRAWLEFCWIGTSQNPDNRIMHGTSDPMFILDSSVRVAVSYHSDYPDEAIILDKRIHPSKIRGIMIRRFPPPSSSIRETYTSRQELYERIGERYNTFADENILEFNEVIHGSELLSLLNQRSEKQLRPGLTAFIKWARKKGITDDEMTKILEIGREHAKSDWKEERLARLKEELGPRYEQMNNLAKEFLSQYITEGETIMQVLVRFGKKHKIPVYGIAGNLIWPQRLSNAEVSQMLQNRTETKNKNDTSEFS